MNKLQIDLAIIGAPKCGSTSLYNYLANQESLFAITEAKDFPVFSRPEDLSARLKRLRSFGYVEYCKNPVLIGDVNISFDKKHLEALKQFNANVKVILLIRSPLKRIKSSFDFNVERLIENRSLSSALNEEAAGILPDCGSKDWLQKAYFQHTDYNLMINNCNKIFGRENVFVLDFDDLITKFTSVLSHLEKFIGVNFDRFDPLPKSNITAGQLRFGFAAKFLFQRQRSSKLSDVIRRIMPQKMRSRLRFFLRDLMRKPRSTKPSDKFDEILLSKAALMKLKRLECEHQILRTKFGLHD